MAETGYAHRARIVHQGYLTRTRAAGAASGRCPACGLPQGPFTERRGQTVTCLACHARFDDAGNLLWDPRNP
jgi:hypothetical protein